MTHTDDRYWDARLETLPPNELAVVQDHRLQWQAQRCWLGSAFYRGRFERAGLEWRAVRGRADLHRLPILTDRELDADWRANPPDGSAVVAPRAWWAERERLDRPDGSEPILTDGDVIHRTGLAARALWAFGARPDAGEAPIVDPVSDGVRGAEAVHRAAEAGLHSLHAAAPIRVRWHLALPQGRLIAPGSGSPEAFVVLGHPRVGSALAFECEARAGLHWAEDHYLLEILDPATLAPVPDGDVGALAVTHLTREGCPVLRYWTGWETALDRTPCRCGRTGARSATIARARPSFDDV